MQWTTWAECSPRVRPPLLLSGCRTQGPWFTLFTPPECQGGSEQEGVRGQVLATSTWASRARRLVGHRPMGEGQETGNCCCGQILSA